MHYNKETLQSLSPSLVTSYRRSQIELSLFLQSDKYIYVMLKFLAHSKKIHYVPILTYSTKPTVSKMWQITGSTYCIAAKLGQDQPLFHIQTSASHPEIRHITQARSENMCFHCNIFIWVEIDGLLQEMSHFCSNPDCKILQ